MKNALSYYIDRLTAIENSVRSNQRVMTEDELAELNKIIGHMQSLKDINTDGDDVTVEPTEK